MSAQFLSGMLFAWAAAQLGLGAFFTLAHFVGRREPEYLLFGLLCMALAVMSSGSGLVYLGGSEQDGLFAFQVSLGGVIVAAALNVHFALCFAQVKRVLPSVLPLYGLALGFELANFGGAMWSGSHSVVSRLFGVRIEHVVAVASPLGQAFYATGLLETLGAMALLFHAYRRGRREALAALLGAGVMLPAVLNDAGLGVGLFRNTVSLLPHVFVLFAFGVAGTLLFRYRLAAGELSETARRLELRTEELRSSYAELRLLQTELVTKKQLAAVGELAAAIAHEVRNPLAVIVNAVAGLRRTGSREEDRAMLLGIVDEEAGRLNRLVTDLLRFARPVSVRRSPVSLVELANRSRAQVKDGHRVVVDVHDDPDIQTVWVDPSLFRLVFDNLVENACQAMQGGGRVEIALARGTLGEAPAVQVEIKDHGHGMDPEVRDRALDPFFTTRPSGTGLGLPIVHRIVEAHGGQIHIDSGAGVGTTVRLLLPLGAPAEDAAIESAVPERVA